MTSRRGLLALFLMLIAIAFLYPGVTQPVLTLSGTIEKSDLAKLGVNLIGGESVDGPSNPMLAMFSRFLGLDQIEGQVLVYQTTRSIWQTVTELSRSGNLLVGLLIVFFSVVIPVFKLLLQALCLLPFSEQWRQPLLAVNMALSKWSMADVFVVALLVAYMAGAASGQMGDLLLMDAQLERGFYFFLAYCLFSIAAAALLRDVLGAATDHKESTK